MLAKRRAGRSETRGSNENLIYGTYCKKFEEKSNCEEFRERKDGRICRGDNIKNKHQQGKFNEMVKISVDVNKYGNFAKGRWGIIKESMCDVKRGVR